MPGECVPSTEEGASQEVGTADPDAGGQEHTEHAAMEQAPVRGEERVSYYPPSAEPFDDDFWDSIARKIRSSPPAPYAAHTTEEEDLRVPDLPRMEGRDDVRVLERVDADCEQAEQKEELPVDVGRIERRKDAANAKLRREYSAGNVRDTSLMCPKCLHVWKLRQQAPYLLGGTDDQRREHRSSEEHVQRRKLQRGRKIQGQYHSGPYPSNSDLELRALQGPPVGRGDYHYEPSRSVLPEPSRKRRILPVHFT